MKRGILHRWLGPWLAAAMVGSVLAACVAPMAPEPDALAFDIATDKPDNVVTVTADGERLLVDVRSASGIGSAGVRLAAGAMPPLVLMRFHLRGLEQMTMAFGDTVVRLSVPSGGDRPVLQSVIEAGQERAITPASPYWMEVAQPVVGGTADNVFEVASPQAFADSTPTNFTLGWIDFFR